MKNLKVKKFIFHPILFGIYPALALYFVNRHEIVFNATQKVFLTALFFSFLIIVIFWALFRSWEKAAIPASVTLLFFYSYGHIYDVLKNSEVFANTPLGRHRYLFPILILLLIATQILIKKIKDTSNLNSILNTVSLFLIGFVFIQITVFSFQTILTNRRHTKESTVIQENNSLENNTERDVYYILVDAYSREDLLLGKFGFDNQEFIKELESLGFYVPNCAQSNYNNTLMSMTATLNMAYLDTLGIDQKTDKSKYIPYLIDSLVMQKFENMGYSVATFKSLYPFLDIKDVAYYHDYFEKTSTYGSHAGINFQYLFLRTTLLRPLIESIEIMDNDSPYAFINKWLPIKKTIEDRNTRQYQQNVYALDSLEKIPEISGKKFTYAHLFVTHQPFVFYPDGRFHPDLLQTRSAYLDQVVFLNQRILEIVKNILDESETPPIIVIQSDHSYLEGADRVKILNAYYLPNGGNEKLYETITPVNTFRLIFDTYFNDEYPLLSDKSYYINGNDTFQEAPSTCVHQE